MRATLITSGSMASVAVLQAACPTASRQSIVTWRTLERARRRRRLHVVQWHRPGRVWAMDFSVAPQRIDGVYRAILHVRDLASGYYLAALPVTDLTSATVCGLLRALTTTRDAPLVLKVDNGSAFRSAELRAWAAAAGTLLLYSPPRCPRYNGSIEASIASVTVRAHHAAVQAGHPQTWSCSDLEAARQSANVGRLRRRAPTAAQRWSQRRPVTRAERERFAEAHAVARRRITHRPERVQQRIAIVDTLQSLGYVSITRRVDLVH